MKRSLRLVAALLACAGAVMGPAGADPTDPTRSGSAEPTGRAARPQHSSDGVVGEIAPTVPAHRRGRAVVGDRREWTVAPGVRLTTWSETDARGPVDLSLLAVEWDRRGVRLDYAGPRRVSRTSTVPDLVGDDAVAGVNGDFFDIGDTGAPLGLGRDRETGLRHARDAGWNAAFYVARRGTPRIGELPMQASIVQRPGWAITNLNSPSVAADGIGVYTAAWGRTAGYRVTDGQRRGVRMVLVRRGRVVENTGKLPTDTRIRGTMLVGRGAGASRLKRLRTGSRVDVRWSLAETPRMAITGNKFLILDGVVTVVDDKEMHPRTAIGIDRDTREVLLLVVDGRQEHSRGYTMVELAEKMAELGADSALNLDGGGSSTMVTRNRWGNLKVRNSPSDGSLRPVANALEVRVGR